MGVRVVNRLLFVALVSLGIVPAIAVAQTEDGAPEGRLILGPSLSISPAVVFVAGRDTNSIRTQGGDPANEFYVVPQIEGWLGRGRVRLNFANALEVSQQRTPEGSGGSTLNHYHEGRLNTGGRRIGIEGTASYRDHYAPPTDFEGFERGLKSRRIETELGTVVSLRPGGRLMYTGRLSRARLRYDADALFRGVSLEQNLNRNITLFGGEAQLALTPLSALSVSVSAFHDRFIFAPERDGNGLRVLFGGDFAPRALLSGRAEVGYLRYQPLQTGVNFGGPAYNLGLSLAKSPLFLNVTGRRTVEFSFDPSKGYFVSTDIDVFSSLTLKRSWEAFARGVVRGLSPRGDFVNLEPDRRIDLFKAGLARTFGVSTKIGVDVEKYKTGGPGGFSGLRTTLFFIYGTTRLQRLDRPLPGGF